MIKKRSLAKLIVLSFLTLGIYPLVFWWSFINDMNEVCVCDCKKSPSLPVVVLLSLLTFGLYGLVWFYRQGERLNSISSFYGVPVKEGGRTIVFYQLCGFFLIGLGATLPQLAQLGVQAEFFSSKDAMVFGFAGAAIFGLAGLVMVLNALVVLLKNFNIVAAAYNDKNSR